MIQLFRIFPNFPSFMKIDETLYLYVAKYNNMLNSTICKQKSKNKSIEIEKYGNNGYFAFLTSETIDLMNILKLRLCKFSRI